MRKELQDRLDRIRKARNAVSSSDFIQVQQSDLYDWNRGLRAVLSTIAFMQATKENPNYPKDSPWKDDYVGWCYASQAYLARRVGGSERQLRRDIARMEKDGAITVREWTDSNGRPHCEYHVNEDVVQAHKRPDDKEAPRPKRSSREYKANKGSFSKGNQPLKEHSSPAENSECHRTSQPPPQDISAVDHRSSEPLSHRTSQTPATAEMTVKGVDSRGLPFSPFPQDGRQLVPAAPELGAAAPVDVKKNIEPSKGSWADRNRPEGQVTKGEKKPLPNWRCYEELFRGCVDKQGNWLGGRLPLCRRCKNILPPQEHHDCPGFRYGELEDTYLPLAPAGTEAFDGPPRKRPNVDYQTFDDFDEPEEDDLSGYKDFDDDHLPRAAAREEL
ncbi:MAG: hypothetical protein WB558_07255 [Terriglobales bacterium]